MLYTVLRKNCCAVPLTPWPSISLHSHRRDVSLLKSWLIIHCLYTLSVLLSIYKWFGYFLILTVGDDSTLNMRMQISAWVVHYFSLGVPYVCVCIVWHLIVWQFYFDDLRKFIRHSLMVESVYIRVQQYTKVLFALYPQWHFLIFPYFSVVLSTNSGPWV